MKETKEAPIMATKTETRSNGFVPGAAHLALDVVDRGQSTTLALLQDARAEVRAVVEGGIELAEKTTASLFRFAKKLTARVDEGVNETIGGVERLLSGAVKTARETTKLATETATTAIGGVTGQVTAQA